MLAGALLLGLASGTGGSVLAAVASSRLGAGGSSRRSLRSLFSAGLEL